ncbi:hypothetical protein [Streptomyces lunaelactis]|uniref:hypothetical protein n=1 Tax=Streptomyces lunaelactis TaxID=1535768 RepID=UPI0015853083|nr:hypothetical protein [Streptomyces lunaelactis]NUL21858.1 hypothetical protein [Streptomyces lunaelactis]
MVNFLDTQSDARRFAALLDEYDRRLKALERSTQAAHTSIEGGAMDIYDADGNLKGSVGVQPDGGVALVPVDTAPPPTPMPPTVEPVLAGLVVGWDGTWDDSYSTPTDFSLMQVHLGPAADFVPDVTTLVATITAVLGGTATVAVEGYDPMWVRLVAQNTASITGPPSTAVQGAPRQAVPKDLIDGIIDETKLAEQAVSQAKVKLGAIGADQLALGAGNLAPDPSFEGPQTAQLISARPEWTLTTPGNNSPTALSVDCTNTVKDWRSLGLATLRVLPGERHFLAFDFKVSADFDGTGAKLFLRYDDPDGKVLGYGVAAAPLVLGGPWARTTAQVQAPAGTVSASLRVEASQASVGRVWFDNVEARTVIAAGMVVAGAISATELAVNSVTAEKIVALGITAEKIAALAITADKLAALSVTADKLAANAVTATKILAGSINATHIKAGSLTADRLALGTDGNLIADPGFENAVTSERVAGAPYWSVVTPGNDTPRAVRVDATATTAITRTLVLALAPAVPGQKMFLGVDYFASPDWAGRRISIYARWEDATGGLLGYSTVTTGEGAVITGGWQRIQGVPDDVAPAGTVTARVTISTNESTAGTVTFDNAICRIVLASGFAGARAELSPQGLLLYDDDGQEAVALVTGRPNYLTLATDGTPVATIDQGGNAGFQDLHVAGDFTIGGDSLTAILDARPRGILAVDYQATSVATTGTEMGFVELAFTAETDRMYRVVLDCYADPSAAGGEVQIFLRDGGTGAPLISSPQIQSVIYPMAGTGGLQRVRLEDVRHGTEWGAGTHRLLITFKNVSGPSGQTVRLLGGTSYRGMLYIEDTGPIVLETGVYNTGGASTTPPPQKYTKTYSASWSGSYAARGSYNSYYGNKMMQGYYSSTNGMQSSLVGFPAAMTSDLSGATINKAEVYLYFDHWYNNAGGKAVIKAHSHASRPGSFSSDAEATTISWAKNQGKWVDITSVFDSTKWRGIALDPNNSSSTYYGRARGYGETNPPKLRVTYTK